MKAETGAARVFFFGGSILFLFLALFLAGGCAYGAREAAEEYDVVVYGGTFAGCAAARTAAQLSPQSSVLVVVPLPEHVLGGTGTAGGQNFFDIRYWRGEVVTGGSFTRWFKAAGRFYGTREMAEILRDDLAGRKNITILWGYDVEEVRKGLVPGRPAVPPPGGGRPSGGAGSFSSGLLSFRIKELGLREVSRDGDGVLFWGERRRTVAGRVFIDASDDGRLTRLAAPEGCLSTGRGDWPAEFLPPDEREQVVAARQQAATLMFKVRGVVPPPRSGAYGDLFFLRDPQTGAWGVFGGRDTYRKSPAVVAFNELNAPRGFALKPLNAAQDGPGSDQWWVNALLVFNVDGRACRRDLGSGRYPQDKRPGTLDADEAWLAARNLIARPEFLEALRCFSVPDGKGGRCGFFRAELVRDAAGRPEVGSVLYLRETIHLAPEGAAAGGGGREGGFPLSPRECRLAGEGPARGEDRQNYPSRIGLAHYLQDVNAYTAEDLRGAGGYRWPVTDLLRPDLAALGEQPQNPVYLPYEMLVTPRLANLLVPGYATGAASLSWAQVRVIPSLCVLGDAAGAAVAEALAGGGDPAWFGQAEIWRVQSLLRGIGARLEK
jgi:hypothetical protein